MMENNHTGKSYSDAIIIIGEDDFEGTEKIWVWLDDHLGHRNEDWFFLNQSLENTESGVFDVMTVRLKNGEQKDYFFDISDTFGKGF